MAYPGKDGLLIRRIQRAGLGKVRAVANSSPASAAQKCGIGRGAVWYRLTKYARIAESILDTTKERND